MSNKFTSLDDINQYNNYNRIKRFLAFSYSHFFTASAPLPAHLKFALATILAQKNHSEWEDVPPQYIEYLWNQA